MQSPPLFDDVARVLRRERAARRGPAPFLAERAFSDIEERVRDATRRFRSALLVGALGRDWPERLRALADRVTVLDPAPSLSHQAGGIKGSEIATGLAAGSFDLVIAAGTLDTVNNLPAALIHLRELLEPDGLLLGAVPAAGSLPRLRAALLAADEAAGAASPRIHPALDVRTTGDLLAKAGYTMIVVDLDRVRLGYSDPLALVRDLRDHGATNILARRSRRPLLRRDLQPLVGSFGADGGRTYEDITILHFSAWSPAEHQPRPAKRGSGTISLAAALGRSAKSGDQR